MVVRGAPAIGQVAAIGLAMSAEAQADGRPYARKATLRGGANALINARPTAVNLRWAVERVLARYVEVGELSEDGFAIARAMRAEADAIVFEATTDHGRLAAFGLEILPAPEDRPVRILTHCNTGPLACGQYGTALGIVQAAHHADRPVHVWVDETRPYLQGARLTTWELAQAGVPHALLPDVAAGHLMSLGEVDVVLVGADRVAANGDTANKVGTYPLAVLAARHGIPFYVCAPTSSVDLDTPDGSAIVIEERNPDEVLEFRGVRVAPPGTDVRNPAFDVTPAELITGIITEEGVLNGPFEAALRDATEKARERWASMPGFHAIRPPAETEEAAAGIDGPTSAVASVAD
jgi:methylthioribose-1-phosphate isomerase